MGMASKSRLLCLPVVVIGLMRLPASGQEHCPANTSDTSFPGGYITRVVGPGTPGEFAADGSLNNWDSYSANKVVSSTAYAAFFAGCVYGPICDGQANSPYTGQIIGKAQIWVNGYLDSNVPISGQFSDAGSILCLKISTKHLHFAHLAAPGQTPSVENGLAGGNEIYLVFSHTVCSLSGHRTARTTVPPTSMMA
jgi:hypothetical protein